MEDTQQSQKPIQPSAQPAPAVPVAPISAPATPAPTTSAPAPVQAVQSATAAASALGQKLIPESHPVANVPMDEKVLAALCYVPFLSLLTCPLAVIKKPQSKFCEFHASQALLLFVAWFLSLLVLATIPSLALGGVLWLALLLASLFGIVKAFTGYEFKIPGLGALATHIPVKSFFVSVKKQAGVPPTQSSGPSNTTPQAQ